MAGVTALDASYLIHFKAKAWVGLSDRKSHGEPVDSKNIWKHKNDVFCPSELLDRNMEMASVLPEAVKEDMRVFIGRMESEDVEPGQLGIRGKTKEDILEELKALYL